MDDNRHVQLSDAFARMEIVLKYFVMTELFICNFVCRCFFWEESHLDSNLHEMPQFIA